MKHLVSVMLIALALAACGDEETTDPGQTLPPAVVSVAVTPASAALVSLGTTVQLTASALDANGNTISGKTFTWSSSDESLAMVSSSGEVTAVANGSVTIIATTAGVNGTAAVDVFQVAAKLAFIVEPTTANAGVLIAPAVEVAIQDAAGSTVSDATDAVMVAIGTNPGSGTLTGTTTVNAVAGVASFTDLTIDQAGTGYTLMVSSGSLSTATSGGFIIARILFDNGSTSGAQSNTANTAGSQELFEDFTLSQSSVITTIKWQQHDHNTATYLSTEVVIFAGLPFDGPPVFSSTIIAKRMPNATGTLFDAWDGFDYEMSGLSINLPPGTYWLGLNANFQGIRSGWDNTTGGPNTIPDFRVVNMNFPAPGRVTSGNLAFTLDGSPVTNTVVATIDVGTDPTGVAITP